MIFCHIFGRMGDKNQREISVSFFDGEDMLRDISGTNSVDVISAFPYFLKPIALRHDMEIFFKKK